MNKIVYVQIHYFFITIHITLFFIDIYFCSKKTLITTTAEFII